jgi:ribonucleoside-diphosphate reductase alpha chain
MKIDRSTPGPVLSPNALYILKKRYLKRDIRGRVSETPSEMFRRVASVVAGAELGYGSPADAKARENAFFGVMSRLEFLPNSPTLLNAGRLSGQMSSCFVLPVGDSAASLETSIEEAKTVHRSGGGTGFNLSRIRPREKESGGFEAAGPTSFLAPLSRATAAVKQGGIRMGCNIATLDVHHPDILSYIHTKNSRTALPNFYLSVGVTSEFMEAVKKDKNYSLNDPATGKTVRTLRARAVFDKIVEQTWKTGDPGLIFLDRIQEGNPVPVLGEIEGVSGCGEQLLFGYESCNLGSVNLARMLDGHRPCRIDYVKLAETVRLAVRFLDDVIDVNRYPLPQIADATLRTRKIGLGVMGFADMLARLGVPYGSSRAVALAEKLMGFINDEAHLASESLGAEKGVFPAFKGSIYEAAGRPMRNASCTTVAPTGTISLIAGCSNGIEPFFALIYMRRIRGGNNLLEVNREFIRATEKCGFYSVQLVERLAAGARLSEIPGIPDGAKRLFATASEIKATWHIGIQAAFQRHVDNAVSKTVNLPNESTPGEIADIYLEAYELGLKGITIYRDGSRRKQPLEGCIKPGMVEGYLKKAAANGEIL